MIKRILIASSLLICSTTTVFAAAGLPPSSITSIGPTLSLSNGVLGLPAINTSGAATYNNITVDAQGRLTAVRGFNSSDITGALGYTPVSTSGGNITATIATASGGTTSRTAASHFGDSVNILDYGADPTGVANSEPAFVAAANTVATGTDITIHVPKGIYNMLSTFTSSRNVNLIIDAGTIFTGVTTPYGARRIETLTNGYHDTSIAVTSTSTSGAEAEQIYITEASAAAPPGREFIRINTGAGTAGTPINDVAQGTVCRWDGGGTASSVNVSCSSVETPFPKYLGSGSIAEWNPMNRHQDAGWSDVTGADWWGGLLMVPEVDTITGGAQVGFPTAFGFANVRSSHTSVAGYKPQTYNGFISYKDSIAPGGDSFYAGGDTSGTTANYPYAPLRITGNWLHGNDTTAATYLDGFAYKLETGQGIGWTDGTGTSSITSTGTAGNDSIAITPAGTGIITMPSSITVGTNTSSPVVTINGTAGTSRGIRWNAASIQRWVLETSTANDDLELFSYDPTGAFVGTVIDINETIPSIKFGFPVTSNYSSSTAAVGVTLGFNRTYTNTSGNNVVAERGNYTTNATTPGFDIGQMQVMVATATTGFPTTGTTAFEGEFHNVLSPNDTTQTQNWSTTANETDIVNRGGDKGWDNTRQTQFNNTGAYLAVAEESVVGQGGAGYNSLYGYTVAHSASNGPNGFPTKIYNGHLCEPNSMVGLAGYCVYASGDITGVTSQIPFSPFGADGAWATGVDMRLTTLTDGSAFHMAVGQSLTADSGVTRSGFSLPSTPTATAKITAVGSGANLGWSLTVAGTGTNTLGGHIIHTGTVPTIASGFGTSPTIVGNDSIGRITVGTGGATTGTITFISSWTNAPVCSVQDETASHAVTPTPTTTGLTIAGVFSAGDNVSYRCEGF